MIVDLLYGRNLLPVLGDPAGPGPESAFCALYPVGPDSDIAGRAVRTSRWAYSAFSRGRIRESLFDLDRDPGETRNLVSDPSASSELSRHRALLRSWLTRTSDPFPAP